MNFTVMFYKCNGETVVKNGLQWLLMVLCIKPKSSFKQPFPQPGEKFMDNLK